MIPEYILNRPDDVLEAEMGDVASDLGKRVAEIRKRVPDPLPYPAADGSKALFPFSSHRRHSGVRARFAAKS